MLSWQYKYDTGWDVVRGRVSKEREFADTQFVVSYTVQLTLNHKFGFKFPGGQIKKENTIYWNDL